MNALKELPHRATQNRILDLREERGSLEMFTPLPRVLVTRATGHMCEAFADGWITATQRLMEGDQTVSVFNEWGQMGSYESAARRKLTDWMLSHRTRFSDTNFTTNSRIVAMGVSVAGAAVALVSIKVELHTREEFLRRLEVALRGRQA